MPGTEEVIDRRASIAAAFEEAEKEPEPVAEPTTEPVVSEPVVSEPVERVPAKPPAKPEGGESTDPEPTLTVEEGGESVDNKEVKEFPVDKAPQSWRGPQKEKWASLPPDVRQEVVRREREITRTLSESADARKFSGTFQQLVAPFMPRFQQLNAHPLHAIQELLKADQILSSAPKMKRAQYVAKLIEDYDVDIEALDSVLSGRPEVDPVERRVEQLLQKRLEPFQRYMSEQQRVAQETERETEQRLVGELQAMAGDTDKYPHFQDVKEDMADIYEIQAKKGVYLSLDQVYNRAIAMNPEVSREVAAKQVDEAKRKSALEANQRAQKAKSAGVSPRGVPSSTANETPSANDRRATIAAALDGAAGR